MTENSDHWDIEIYAEKSVGSAGVKEIFRFKDLLFLFVKRDFISIYKQTILGPLWIILQPLITSFTLTVIFGYIANINTGAPTVLFMLAGVTVWAFFSDCVLKTSETFIANQNIFGKVYFPRLIVPLSVVFTNLIKFAVQFGLFILFYGGYVVLVEDSSGIHLSWHLVLLPIIVLIMGLLGLGTGLIISSLTTKYRDLRFLIQFGIQLAMYASPIVYPLAMVPEKYKWILLINPMTSVIETFKVGFFGAEFAVFSWWYLGYSFLFALVLVWIGTSLFTKIERSFMDTI